MNVLETAMVDEEKEESLTNWQLIKEDLATHAGKWTECGFRAIVIYRFGGWAGSIRFRFLRKAMLFIYLIFYLRIRNYYGIELPASVKLGRRVRIAHQSGIVIHPNAVIGDDCFLRQNVTIGQATGKDENAPVLGKDVSVGAGAVLIGAITIGDGARIGPNAVVTQNVPDEAAVFGNPARIFPIARQKESSPTTETSKSQMNG